MICFVYCASQYERPPALVKEAASGAAVGKRPRCRGGLRSATMRTLLPVPVVLAERHASCFLGRKAPSCLFTKNRLPLDPPLRPALPTIILIILRLCSMPGTFVASVSIGLVRPAICPVLGSFFFALFLFVSIVWYSTRIEGSYNYDI